ncbi:MAG: peptidylprolyl isomerase [Pseudomonadota bacterium]|nr:peptidylprolyl isomerase [Pseudomonadota bacterium]
MKNKPAYYYFRIIFILAVCTCSNSIQTSQAKVVNQLLAEVGSQIITTMDVIQAVNLEYGPRKFSQLSREGREQAKQKQLHKLVDDILLVQLAQKKGIDVTDKEIDLTIKRVMEQNKMNDEQLKRALKQQGMSLKSYRSKLIRDLLRTKLINQEIKPHIILADKEILSYAKKNNLFPEHEAQVTLSQILLPLAKTETEKDKLKKTVAEIKKRLKKGESFAPLAREFSIGPAADSGGKLGNFNKGQLLPEIEAVAFGKLPVNQMSDIIQTRLGNHLIMVLRRIDPQGSRTLESLSPEVESKIKNVLFTDKVKHELEQMRVKLRQEFSVKYKNSTF